MGCPQKIPGTADIPKGILPCLPHSLQAAVFAQFQRFVMDCTQFRKHHLAYLDNTLPGETMAVAQHHVMVCDGCAAHDTLVRRSLMVARSLPTIEPSDAFQRNLRARLAECREERRAAPPSGFAHVPAGASARPLALRPSRALMAVAASAVLGAIAYQAIHQASAPPLSMQPVIASQPAPVRPATPALAPELVQAMSAGNPVWPAAMMVDDASMQAMNAGFSLVSTTH